MSALVKMEAHGHWLMMALLKLKSEYSNSKDLLRDRFTDSKCGQEMLLAPQQSLQMYCQFMQRLTQARWILSLRFLLQ